MTTGKGMLFLARQLGWFAKLFAQALLVFMIAGGTFFLYVTAMPGESFRAMPPPLDSAQQRLAATLRRHVETLCRFPDRRYDKPEHINAARDYIRKQFEIYGYQTDLQTYPVIGWELSNVEAFLPTEDNGAEILVIGAHYDSVFGSPGANDNASGVAVLLELAALLRHLPVAKQVRFVAFSAEEPPFFQAPEMGSRIYAQALKSQGVKVKGMVSLETLGYYSNQAGSQLYPRPLSFYYPDRGNFVAFVGNLHSRDFVRKAIGAFRRHATMPSEGIAAPPFIPGVDFSDHSSFWDLGYPAFMLTDTAFNRYEWYHEAGDTPEKLDYAVMARLVQGLAAMTVDLVP